jgi:hypothetical protein
LALQDQENGRIGSALSGAPILAQIKRQWKYKMHQKEEEYLSK